MALFIVPAILFSFIAMWIPATPRQSRSLLFAKIDKDRLLIDCGSPRIVLVGGSNISYGINSPVIKERISMNPVNLGIDAGLGLLYMLDSSIEHIRTSDIVVVSPEYSHFYGDFAFGNQTLLRTVLDVDRKDIALLKIEQWMSIYKYIPRLVLSRIISAREYFYNVRKKGDMIYSRQAFNIYGDAIAHYEMESKEIIPYGPIQGQFNYSIMERLCKYRDQVAGKGARLFVTYPGFQAASYDNSIGRIKKIKEELNKEGFDLLGTPERYRMPDRFIFNTPYHLNKAGAILRTELLVEDLLTALPGLREAGRPIPLN